MTQQEALVSISQTLLRVNGRWTVDCGGLDATLRQDIRATVGDAARLFRFENDGDEHRLTVQAVAELERRASI